MSEFWTAVSGMLEFASKYCMDKCVRTMLIGMMIMLFLFLMRIGNRSNRAEINFYSMLLLLIAGFTGKNKLFFLKHTGMISAYISYYIKPFFGKIYFSVMAILLVRFVWRNRQMKKQVRKLSVWENDELAEAIAFVTDEDLPGWQKKYLKRVKIYVTEECVSPFSGGLLHPYVVMPARVLQDWPKEERKVALCHELAHLKSGHIFWMVCFQLLKIYWWANPLIYLCDRKFRNDMEMVCDESCVRHTKVSAGMYGRTLLNMVTLMQSAGVEGNLCFLGGNDFRNIRKRILSLSCLNAEQGKAVRSRRYGGIFAVIAAALFAVIIATSYPKYTVMREIVLFDENSNILDYDSEELRSAVSVLDDRLVIDHEKFRDIITKKNIIGDYVYISYGGIMKVPGVGGGSNAGMIALADYNDVFYMMSEGVENDILLFWLKYLV